jgi:tetratricopeptide (TPR) repeat protein
LTLAKTADERPTSLNNLVLMQKDKNDFDAAEWGYQEALNVYRELARSNPQTYLPYVAEMLINLGIFYLQSVPDKAKSLDFLAEALRILRPLTAKLPYSIFKFIVL